MAQDYANVSIQQQNAQKVFVVKASLTSSSSQTDLTANNDVDGLQVMSTNLDNQPMLVLQGTQDFWYNITKASSGTVSKTNATGIKVLAGQQEYVAPTQGHRYLNIIEDSADGSVSIFVVRQ